MLTFASLLTAFISYFISSFFNRSAYFFITFFAVIIFNIELLSLFKQINGVNILILTSIEAIITLFIWIKKNRPTLKLKIPFDEIKTALLQDKSLIILSLAWLIFIISAFTISIISPVCEPDAQSYHVLRALYWLRDGFIYHFETVDTRNIYFPINSELFYTWLLALHKKDTLVGLLQFFSYFQLIFCSFKIMEKFDIEFVKRIWAILIFSSFPIVIIQASGTQTDLCVGALLISSLYFVLEYKKERSFNLLFFAALSMGISFGVKTTSFMAALPLLIWFIFILRKDFIKFFIFLFINSVIFSSYNYILNYIDAGSFFSNDAAYIYHRMYGGIKGVIANLIKFFVQFFDFSGFNIGNYFNDYIIGARNFILNALSIPLDWCEIDPLTKLNVYFVEQRTGFGILGFLIFIPCLIVGLFSSKLRIFSSIFLLQVLILSSVMAYTVYSIRFFTTFASISLIVLTLSYFRKMNIIKLIIIFYAVFYMGYISFFSHIRPLAFYIKNISYGLENIQNEMRDNTYYFFHTEMRTKAAAIKTSVEPHCKNGNKIAIFAPGSYILYPAKYLEIHNDCEIDTLNALHINDYDLKKYSVIITGEDLLQRITQITKKDIENPITKSNMLKCFYILSDKGVKSGLANAMQADCYISDKYIKSLGFKPTNLYYYLAYKVGDGDDEVNYIPHLLQTWENQWLQQH